MIEILRDLLGLNSENFERYYSQLVQASLAITIIFFILVSVGLYRLWKYIIKF